MTKDQLASKALEAVDALLGVIKRSPGGYVGNSQGGWANGTDGLFAAQAIKTLLETPIIGELVESHLTGRLDEE